MAIRDGATRDVAITIRVTVDMKHALYKAADEERRPLASLAVNILEDWLTDREANKTRKR